MGSALSKLIAPFVPAGALDGGLCALQNREIVGEPMQKIVEKVLSTLAPAAARQVAAGVISAAA